MKLIKKNKPADSYGVTRKTKNKNQFECKIEEINLQGYTIIENVLNSRELRDYSRKIDEITETQKEDFTKKKLEKINELNIARCLLAYDNYFFNILEIPILVKFIKFILGNNYTLILQNSVTHYPNESKKQAQSHRDMPYQDYTISKPVALNAYFNLEKSSEKYGGLKVLPFSHKLGKVPSDEYISNNAITIEADKGSLIIFNSWIYHSFFINKSKKIRRIINHIFAKPIYKQQIDIPKALGEKKELNPNLRRVLGYDWESPISVEQYRLKKLLKGDK